MKYLTIIILLVVVYTPSIKSQEIGIEKSVWGIQTLMFPLSIYNETKLTNSIALRSELSWGFGWTGSYISNMSNSWAIIPYLNVEPRYYYNLEKRNKKGKRTDANSGNYLSLFSGFQPGFGITSEDVNIHPMIYVIPSYGLRRNIGKHFNFEAAFGIGYGWAFEKYKLNNNKTQRRTDKGSLTNIRLAFGYVF